MAKNQQTAAAKDEEYGSAEKPPKYSNLRSAPGAKRYEALAPGFLDRYYEAGETFWYNGPAGQWMQEIDADAPEGRPVRTDTTQSRIDENTRREESAEVKRLRDELDQIKASLGIKSGENPGADNVNPENPQNTSPV